MKKIFSRFDLYPGKRLYISLAMLIFMYIAAYAFPSFLTVANVSFVLFVFFISVDIIALILPSQPIAAKRKTLSKWSLGDENKISIEIKNNTSLSYQIRIEDEVPDGLPLADYTIKMQLPSQGNVVAKYTVTPLKRGEYQFGKIRIFISAIMGIFSRRISIDAEQKIAVYPSVLQLKKHQLSTVKRMAAFAGNKKMNRPGHSYEFDQIKDYVQGDDLRYINWKSTGKTGSIKTNHFIEEKSQPVYALIDKSRCMNMAFDGLSLLDYSVNAALVLLGNALQKGDRAGLITFSDKTGAALRADNSPGQIRRILDLLYKQEYRTTEADYELLYHAINRLVKNRSLFVLYTNFESKYAMQRALPVLRKISRRHLLVVVLFENSEIADYAYKPAHQTEEVYNRMIARQWLLEKRSMVNEMKQHGIQSILIQPQNLTVATLNRYMELKSQSVI